MSLQEGELRTQTHTERRPREKTVPRKPRSGASGGTSAAAPSTSDPSFGSAGRGISVPYAARPVLLCSAALAHCSPWVDVKKRMLVVSTSYGYGPAPLARPGRAFRPALARQP